MSGARKRIQSEIASTKARLRELEELEEEFAPTPDADLPVNLPSFLAEPATDFDWLVGGEIAKGTTGVLIGEPKKGKSTLAVQLSLCIATGKDFIGRYTYQTPTLYLAAEGARGAFQSRVRTAAKTLGVDERAVQWHIHPVGFTDWTITGTPFRRLIDRSRAGFVVLDTYPLFATQPYNVNEASEWLSKVLLPLRFISIETGCTFLLIHHMGKNGDKTGWQKVLGTTRQFGDTDFFWRFEAHEDEVKYRVLNVGGNKYADEAEPTVLDFRKTEAVYSVVAWG